MRTLKFNVDKQVITKNGDFSGLAVGSENYVEAQFYFSNDWSNAVKVAEFDEVPVLLDGNACIIPDEILIRRKFAVRVVGKDDATKITTNTITIRQGA